MSVTHLEDHRATQPIPALAPATVELPIWSGQPPVRRRSTSHARPSLRRRVARSPLAADVQRHPMWVGGGLAVVGCAIHSLGTLVGAW